MLILINMGIFIQQISIGEGAPFGVSFRTQAKELGITLLPSFELVLFSRFFGPHLSVHFSPPNVIFLEVHEIRMVNSFELRRDLLIRNFIELV